MLIQTCCRQVKVSDLPTHVSFCSAGSKSSFSVSQLNERLVNERFVVLLATWGQRFQGDHGMRYRIESLRDRLALLLMPPVAFCVDIPAVQLYQELCCRFACAGHVVYEVPGPVAGSECRFSGSMVSTGKQICGLVSAVTLQRQTALTTATSDNSRFALKKWPVNLPTLLTLSHNLAFWYSHSTLDASCLLTAHCLLACRHSHTEA